MKAEKKSDNGIAAQDVLGGSPGSRIIATDKPAACAHCGPGSIVFRAWPDGRGSGAFLTAGGKRGRN